MSTRVLSTFEEKKLVYKIRVHADTEAYAKIYDAYAEKIYRFVFFKLNNKDEAEDVASDVFLKAWDYLTNKENEKSVSSVSGLLYRIARNLIIDTYRQRAKEQTCPIEHADDVSHEGHQHQIEQRYEFTALLQSVKKLKHEYQEVIMLRYIEELSLKEVAEILGKNTTNVRVLLHRATKKLEEVHSVSSKQ